MSADHYTQAVSLGAGSYMYSGCLDAGHAIRRTLHASCTRYHGYDVAMCFMFGEPVKKPSVKICLRSTTGNGCALAFEASTPACKARLVVAC